VAYSPFFTTHNLEVNGTRVQDSLECRLRYFMHLVVDILEDGQRMPQWRYRLAEPALRPQNGAEVNQRRALAGPIADIVEDDRRVPQDGGRFAESPCVFQGGAEISQC
jgi:hypothetical protein